MELFDVVTERDLLDSKERALVPAEVGAWDDAERHAYVFTFVRPN